MFSPLKTLTVGLAVATLLMGVMSAPAWAGPRDKVFFKGVSGSWKGPGKIVAGKYKGTKFVCNLAGISPEDGVGITLDGFCRVGMFKQPMKAVITAKAGSYSGTFLDGSNGKGLDIVSGNVTGTKMIIGLTRARLNGAMIAKLQGENTMTVTISVKVEDEMVPVIGMTLSRQVDDIAVGSIK